MICYDIMETGYQIGYIQFVQHSTVITQMHKDHGFWSGPFSKTTIREHFLRYMNTQMSNSAQTNMHTKGEYMEWLKDYHNCFLTSLAG